MLPQAFGYLNISKYEVRLVRDVQKKNCFLFYTWKKEDKTINKIHEKQLKYSGIVE